MYEISSYRGNKQINTATPSDTGLITIHCAGASVTMLLRSQHALCLQLGV